MSKYIDAVRCKTCGKIYPWNDEKPPKYCKKCGAQISACVQLSKGSRTVPAALMIRWNTATTERVIARRTLRGWECREPTRDEMQSEKKENKILYINGVQAGMVKSSSYGGADSVVLSAVIFTDKLDVEHDQNGDVCAFRVTFGKEK